MNFQYSGEPHPVEPLHQPGELSETYAQGESHNDQGIATSYDRLFYEWYNDTYSNDDDADGNDTWQIHRIMNHRRIQLASSTDTRRIYKTQVRILWGNIESSWVGGDVLRLVYPFSMIQYAVRNQLVYKQDWKWVYLFLLNWDDLLCKYDPVHAMRAATSAPRYKFGIEVPRSVKHSLMIDKQNFGAPQYYLGGC